MQGIGAEAHLAEHRGERVAIGDRDRLVTRILRRLLGDFRLGVELGILRFVVAFYLCKRRVDVLLSGSVLIALQILLGLFGAIVHVQIEEGLLCFYFAGGKHQKSET